MSDASAQGLIRVEQVWKQFRLGERHDSLRDLIPSLFRAAVGRTGARVGGRKEFWALRDINVEVRPGQALGVIGGNGAGKSTLLKLVTRILRPTRGRCEVRGRIGALIEIAAGFHPDLTGRENVFLQGAIMGMRTAEIRRQFDQIVEFSGVSEFIDTPVKRYSSGMNARLGFSIAAHLDPDVLIIDEVLSVGDFRFQAKAFDRIQVLVQRQIPVVVVSHQLDRISTLCTDAILLDRGSVVLQGTPVECISAYVQGRPSTGDEKTDSAVSISSLESSAAGSVASGERVTLTVRGRVAPPGAPRQSPSVGVLVRGLQSGRVMFDVGTPERKIDLPETGAFELDVDLDFNVPPGLYVVETHVWDYVRDAVSYRGPSVTVHVDGGPVFAGTVQMNGTMRLRGTCPEPAPDGMI
jgi:lipopolysaccharide transport system ATP-binding protein